MSNVKSDTIADDFGYFNVVEVTICRTQGIEEVTIQHVDWHDSIIGSSFLRRNLDVVSSDNRSLTCVSTGFSDECPVCGCDLNYVHNLT